MTGSVHRVQRLRGRRSRTNRVEWTRGFFFVRSFVRSPIYIIYSAVRGVPTRMQGCCDGTRKTKKEKRKIKNKNPKRKKKKNHFTRSCPGAMCLQGVLGASYGAHPTTVRGTYTPYTVRYLFIAYRFQNISNELCNLRHSNRYKWVLTTSRCSRYIRVLWSPRPWNDIKEQKICTEIKT